MFRLQGNNHSSALSLPTEVQFRANSVPQSPCTNDIRSPHSTSSNQGSDSLSSSELALHDFSFRNNGRKHRPKVSSADSILAMFRNFASSNAGVNLPTSFVFSPSSSTPTASSPQDDVAGDDESSTSSIPTPVSYSSAAESPVFYRHNTIEVPVLDALSAHKSSPTQNLLHPPTILLEIPGNINKCLSPIHELPTPMPSPALTPIMPRPHRLQKSSHIHDEAISVTLSDDDDKNVINSISHDCRGARCFKKRKIRRKSFRRKAIRLKQGKLSFEIAANAPVSSTFLAFFTGDQFVNDVMWLSTNLDFVEVGLASYVC